MYDTIDSESRTWGMLCHLSALIGYVIPLGSVIAPLVVWLMKREQMPFVDANGKESLNFQITMAIAFIISAILMVVLIGFILMPIVAIVNLIFVIIASIKANQGEAYRYPFTLRLIK